jgi:hypothetical protein
MDIRRVWLPRVRVTLIKKHRLHLRRRYEVNYNGKTYFTGRLEKPKEAA